MPAFARELGISRDRLASYEYGRAPLRYWLADKVCAQFAVNQHWLFCGSELPGGYIQLPSALVARINPDELFSTVYRNQFAEYVVDEVTKMQEASHRKIARIFAKREEWESRAHGWNNDDLGGLLRDFLLKWHIRLVPPDLLHAYCKAIATASFDFLQAHNLMDNLPNPPEDR